MRGVAVIGGLGFGRWRLVGFVIAVLMLAASAGTASASTGVSCTTYSGIPVALAAGAPLSYSVSGELCATPGELARGKAVQLLVHGATYNHDYWDFGTIDGISYSYAPDVAAAGFPTFALDEIGAGASSHPASSDITIQVAAYVAHEIVQDLKSGRIGGTSFGKVIMVGHSLGSLVTWEEAATYGDVAGAIVTGGAHTVTSFFGTALSADFYPAIDDPKFAHSGLDSGYLTSVPGDRGMLFYHAADSDPNVIAADEASKDVVPDSELPGAVDLLSSTLTKQITVPVLVILGSDDAIFCGAEVDGATFNCSSGSVIAQQEGPYYSAQAQLRACAVPGSGHDIALSLNHVLEEADAIAWSYEYVGQTPLGTVKSRQLPPDCS